jgi:hypothetical protein
MQPMIQPMIQSKTVVPQPRVAGVSVRTAVIADMPFIDQLQKMHGHMVGWFPRKQMVEYIDGGHVVIAEANVETPTRRHADGGGGAAVDDRGGGTGVPPVRESRTGGTPVPPEPLGYCIACDQYMKRDDVGIIFQLNVLPLRQRNLIGATLIKEVFHRAAYGCRLFSCWCAQDIQANWFWESIGFVPLAFRTGSRAKQRTHIFWQRRVREQDDVTPYWFPSRTGGGALGEDRIVLPIPLGTHWRDAKPLVLPGVPGVPVNGRDGSEASVSERRATLPGTTLPGGQPVRPRPAPVGPKLDTMQKAAIARMHSRHLGGVPPGKRAVISGGRIKYVDRKDYIPELDAPEVLAALEKSNPRKNRVKQPRPGIKNDPKYVAAARELRDRFLEQVNHPDAGRDLLPSGAGKYEVGRPRTLEGSMRVEKAERLRLAGPDAGGRLGA